MKRIFFCLAMTALFATACVPPAASSPPATNTSAGSMSIDEKAIQFSFASLDAVSSAADLLMATGTLKPGSPGALRLANGLETTLRWLNTASQLQRAGRSGDAITAWMNAQKGLAAVRAEIDASRTGVRR